MTFDTIYIPYAYGIDQRSTYANFKKNLTLDYKFYLWSKWNSDNDNYTA